MIYVDSSVALAYLDALHLASAEFLRARGEVVTIASYDGRLTEAAQLMGFSLADI